MGGIGLSCEQPQPNTTHMYAHTHTHTNIHISAYHAQQSCTCIEYRIHIYAAPQQYRYTQFAHNFHTIRTQFAHNFHTIRTQFAHNFHTIRTHTETETNKQRYMQHIQDNREQRTISTQVHYIRFAHI